MLRESQYGDVVGDSSLKTIQGVCLSLSSRHLVTDDWSSLSLVVDHIATDIFS